MSTLPSSTIATGATATEGDVKSFLTNLRAFIADLLGSDSTNRAAVLQQLKAFFSSSLAKNASYTITDADRGKVIAVTGAGGITFSLTAAATLGDGFVFGVANNSSGIVTLDPNLTETINGASTYALQPSETIIVFCDGAKFLLFGKAPASLVSSFNTRTGAVTLTSSDVVTALGFTPSPNNHNHTGTYAPMTAFVGCTYSVGSQSLVFTLANGTSVSVYIGASGG